MASNPDILILGASGMLGSAVRQEVARCTGRQVDGTQKEDSGAPDYMDVVEMQREQWASLLRRRPYQYVINCAGILKPAVNELDTASLRRAIRVNALFPHELAELLPQSRIIHMSTDGVFSGQLDRPYIENDATDCPDAYGKSKALGECPAGNVLNIRCSIIGRDARFAKGLIELVLRSRDSADLTGFEDQLWNGVTTRQFGELCRLIIESDNFDRIRAESGLHHFCPNSAITKYELLCCIRDAGGRDINIRRGHSGAPGARILATVYSQLSALYPGGRSWDSLIREALEPPRPGQAKPPAPPLPGTN